MKVKKNVENINYLSMYLAVNDELDRFVYRSSVDVTVTTTSIQHRLLIKLKRCVENLSNRFRLTKKACERVNETCELIRLN